MIPPLLAYIVFLWIGYYFVDNIMYAAASLRFTGADQFGAFIGQVVVFYGILAAVSAFFSPAASSVVMACATRCSFCRS